VKGFNMKNVIKTKIKLVLGLVAGFVVLVSYQNCAKPVSQSSYVVSGLTELDIAESKALQVLTTRCSSCHSADVPSGGVDVLSVDSLLASGAVIPTEPGLSPLFQAVSGGSMPPSKPLAQDEILAISDWITKMQKDTGVTLPPGQQPLPLGPNYASIYQNVLRVSCLGCHNSGNARGGVSFSTYAATMNTVQRTLPNNSSLYTSIAVRNTMPQGAGGSLSADQKRAIFDWITAGAANN
jgi:uncharacterized membrane protein